MKIPHLSETVGTAAQAGRRGFTLMEVLVAVGVFTTSIMALFLALGSGTSMISSERETVRANQILVEKMETIRLYTFDQITNTGFIPTTFTSPFQPSVAGNTNTGGFTYTGTVTIANAPLSTTYADSLRLVKLSLSWTSHGIAHQRTMSTLVCKNGLQAYVY